MFKHSTQRLAASAAFALLTLFPMTACRSAASRSVTAFSMIDRQLIPEGLAFDDVDGSFFISSVYRRKVVKRSTDGTLRDFTRRDDTFGEILGLEVDRRRGLLWACSYAGVFGGSDALYAFDLVTGEVKTRVVPPAAEKHLLNDVEVGSDGTVYVTDSEAGQVYELVSGAEVLTPMLAQTDLKGPNGIALAPEQGVLFVADDLGLTAIALKTRSAQRVQASGTDVRGIDGLYYRDGRLLGIQNASPALKPRIVAIDIIPETWRVTDVRVLESRAAILGVPTTGVLAGDELYFIAHSGLDMISRSGEIRDSIRPATIRRVKLPPSARDHR